MIDLAALLPSWELALRAERKSPRTVKSYGDGVRQYLRWCSRAEVAADLSRASVAGFVAGLLDDGAAAATARTRQLAVRRFSAWLAEEGETDTDTLLGIKAPKLDTRIVEPLTEAQLKALLKACAGTGLRDRRDEAVVRFMAETGARAGEVVALAVTDLDLPGGTAAVRRGKGGKGRVVPFGPHTARALDRWLRARRTHRLAATPALWLGDRGKRGGFNWSSQHLDREVERWAGQRDG